MIVYQRLNPLFLFKSRFESFGSRVPRNHNKRWWVSFIFLGEMIPILTCAYFSNWVGEPTTNEINKNRRLSEPTLIFLTNLRIFTPKKGEVHQGFPREISGENTSRLQAIQFSPFSSRRNPAKHLHLKISLISHDQREIA